MREKWSNIKRKNEICVEFTGVTGVRKKKKWDSNYKGKLEFSLKKGNYDRKYKMDQKRLKEDEEQNDEILFTKERERY